MSDALLERLLALDTCAISDALDSLDLAGAAVGIRHLAGTPRIAGRAITVRLGTERPVGAPVRHLCTAAIESAGKGNIIVVEQSTGLNAAGWGGVLSNAAQVRGVAGAIVEGPARDIDEAHEIGFSVFARSATCRTARGRVYEIEFNGAIELDGVKVSPGDYLLADGSGIVAVSATRIEEVLSRAERIAAKERLMTRAVHAGSPVGEVMGRDYEEMLDNQR